MEYKIEQAILEKLCQIYNIEKKNIDVVCITNDGGITVIAGISVINTSITPLTSSLFLLNGTSATDYSITPCSSSSGGGGVVTIEAGSNSIAKTEDSIALTGDVGIGALAIRQSAPSNLSSANGDYEFLQMNNGRLWCSTIIDTALPAGSNIIGNFRIDQTTVGTTNGISVAQIANTTVLTNNGIAGAGAQRVCIASDNTPFTVNLGIGGVTATSLGKAEDAVAATGDTGIAVLAVRRDTPTNDVSAAGDYATLQVNAIGSLWTAESNTIVDDTAFTIATSRVFPQGLLADEISTDSVDEGDIGIARMTLDRKAIVTPLAHIRGGSIPYKLISTASTNATSVKASAGQIYTIFASNRNTSPRHLKLYDLAVAPTVGTSVPVQVYIIPGDLTGAGTAFALPIPVGMSFVNGIAFAITGGFADNDTTAILLGDVTVNLTTF